MKLRIATLGFMLIACSSAENAEEPEESELRGNVASNEGYPGAIVADGSTIFWASDQENMAGLYSKSRAARSGDATKVASTTPPTAALTQDATHLYWVDATGTIFSVPKGGGEAKRLGAVEGQRSASIAVDDANVYVSTGMASLSRTPKRGGETQKIATGSLFAMTADAENLYYVRQTKVLGENGPEFGVFRLPKSGAFPGDETQLGGIKNDQPVALVVHGGQLYYSIREPRADRQRVLKVDTATGAETDLEPTELYRPHLAALSGEVVCLANREAITCQRTTGGEPVKVANGKSIEGLAVEGNTVFWTDRAETKGFLESQRQLPNTGAVNQTTIPKLR